MIRRISVAATAVALVVALGACAGAATVPADPEQQPAATDGAFPRTVEVPAGPAGEAWQLVVPSEPRRIAALSYETAELVAALGLADRLVAVPQAVQNPALTNHPEHMSEVTYTVPTESETDPEAIIAQRPDLVLLSPRHGLETGAGAALEAAGIPVLILPNTWSDAEDMVTNILLVGEATGTDAIADALATAIAAGLTATTVERAPRVLVLSNQAGRAFVTAGTAFPLELLRLSGAVDVSAELGVERTGPITAEQVVQADPDGILLIDMNGSEERLFAELLNNPAVAGVRAVSAERMLLVAGREVQALGLGATVDGLERLREWVAGL